MRVRSPLQATPTLIARGGQIAVKAGTKLDYETKSTYRVTVTATDPDNLSASINVTITVMDMNEAPEVTGDAEKDYPENQTRAVASYRATDPEGGAIYWSLLPANTGSPVQDLDATLTDADDADESYFTIKRRRRAELQCSPLTMRCLGDAG